VAQASREVRLIAQARRRHRHDQGHAPSARDLLVLSLARDTGTRIRLYDEKAC
jgi:two-component system sensor histidine kinase ChvG